MQYRDTERAQRPCGNAPGRIVKMKQFLNNVIVKTFVRFDKRRSGNVSRCFCTVVAGLWKADSFMIDKFTRKKDNIRKWDCTAGWRPKTGQVFDLMLKRKHPGYRRLYSQSWLIITFVIFILVSLKNVKKNNLGQLTLMSYRLKIVQLFI